MKRFLKGSKSAAGTEKREFLAENLESRTLYSAAPIDVVPGEEVVEVAGLFEESEDVGVGDFESIRDFGINNPSPFPLSELELDRDSMPVATRFERMPAEQSFSFSELEQAEDYSPEVAEPTSLAFSELPDSERYGLSYIADHLDDSQEFGRGQIDDADSALATVEVINFPIFSFDTLSSLAS